MKVFWGILFIILASSLAMAQEKENFKELKPYVLMKADGVRVTPNNKSILFEKKRSWNSGEIKASMKIIASKSTYQRCTDQTLETLYLDRGNESSLDDHNQIQENELDYLVQYRTKLNAEEIESATKDMFEFEAIDELGLAFFNKGQQYNLKVAEIMKEHFSELGDTFIRFQKDPSGIIIASYLLELKPHDKPKSYIELIDAKKYTLTKGNWQGFVLNDDPIELREIISSNPVTFENDQVALAECVQEVVENYFADRIQAGEELSINVISSTQEKAAPNVINTGKGILKEQSTEEKTSVRFQINLTRPGTSEL